MHHHHAHQSADERHTRKLDGEQRPLPPLFALSVAVEHLRHGNAGKEPPWQHAAHHEQHRHYRYRHPDALRRKQHGKLRRSGVFHKVAEVEQQHRHQQQSTEDDNPCLQQEHPEHRAPTCTAALMHAHRLGAVRQRGDGDKHIVQRGNEEDGKAEDAHDARHAAHVLVVAVSIADGLYKGGVAECLLILCRAILFNHRVDALVHYRTIGTRTETDVLRPAVSTAPRIVSPIAAPCRGHRNHSLGMHRGILGDGGIRPPHGQGQLVVVAELLSDGAFVAKNLLCKTFTQEDDVGLHKVALRITAQYPDTHGAEEQRIGHHLQVVKTHITVVERLRRRPPTYAASSLHLLGEVLENGSRHGTAVLFLRLVPLAISGEHRPHLIKVVIILKASVKTLFICHAGEKQNTHRQSQSQRNDLDDIRTASPQ